MHLAMHHIPGCMTIFQNQTYTALKAGSLILPPLEKLIGKIITRYIPSLLLINKNPGYLPGSCHSYSLPFPLRPARYSLPRRETGQTGTGKKQFFIALQAGKSYTPPVQTSPFPPCFHAIHFLSESSRSPADALASPMLRRTSGGKRQNPDGDGSDFLPTNSGTETPSWALTRKSCGR